MPGWNARIPAGVARCTCRARREWWARLAPEAQQGCCERSCCTATLSTIMATREEVHLLRGRAVTEGWRCPRCGEYVARHERNYSCLDEQTKRLRAQKQASRVHFREERG